MEKSLGFSKRECLEYCTLVVIVLVDSPFAMLDCESVNSHRTWKTQHGYQQSPYLKGHSLSQFYQSFFPGSMLISKRGIVAIFENMLFQCTFEGKVYPSTYVFFSLFGVGVVFSFRIWTRSTKTIWINLRRGGEAGFGKVEGYIYIYIYIVDL